MAYTFLPLSSRMMVSGNTVFTTDYSGGITAGDAVYFPITFDTYTVSEVNGNSFTISGSTPSSYGAPNSNASYLVQYSGDENQVLISTITQSLTSATVSQSYVIRSTDNSNGKSIITVSGVNTWNSGNYIEYNSQKYYGWPTNFNLNSAELMIFGVIAPTIGTDTITYLGTPEVGEITGLDDIATTTPNILIYDDGTIVDNNVLTIGKTLTYGGETRTIGYINYGQSGYDAPLLAIIDAPFTNSPLYKKIGTDITIGTSNPGEIVSDAMGYVVYNFTGSVNIGNFLIYGGEVRQIWNVSMLVGAGNMYIDTMGTFTTSPVGQILGQDVLISLTDPTHVNGNYTVISYGYDKGDSSITVSGFNFQVGDVISFGGSNYTVSSASGPNAFFFGEMIPAPVANVDQVYITVSGGAGVEKRLIPPPGERTVAENDLTPDVRDVPRNDLVPDNINKDKLIP